MRCLDFGFYIYDQFGFEPRLELSTRPEKRVGTEEMWDQRRGRAEEGARGPGPRVRPERGRRRLLRPEDRPPHDRRDRPLVAARHRAARLLHARALRAHLHGRGQRRAPAGDDPPRADGLVRALHRDPDRALRAASSRSGSRRFRPLVLPIADRHNDYAREVAGRLHEAGIRAEVDDRTESVGKKIRDGELHKVPYMLIVGDEEQAQSRGCGAPTPRGRPRKSPGRATSSVR